MSREERRQYQRQMRSMEKGPALPPAARARAERNAARRQMRRGQGDQAAAGSGARFWIRTALIAAALGFLAFSLQWPNMPFAVYLGLAVAAVAVLLLVGFRLLQRRIASRS